MMPTSIEVKSHFYSSYVLIFSLTSGTSTEHTAIIHRTGTFGIDEPLIPNRMTVRTKREVAMFVLIAVLMFAGAMGAAGFTIYATVAPSLSKIQVALSGHGTVSMLPQLPPRRASTLRVAVRPVAQPTYWRAAA